MRALAALAALVAAGSCASAGSDGAELSRALNLPEAVGTVCGDPRILGLALPSFSKGACGIDAPVAVYAVGTVRLAPVAVMNCTAARALDDWAEGGAASAAEATGRRITTLEVAGAYACRRRNNRPTGKLSEHARGNAIDITAIRFARGTRATVRGDWRKSPRAGLMQRLHAAACGPFGVVLGPDANAAHRDHFHFDVSNLDRHYCH